MTISKKAIDLLNLDPEVKAELLKELIEADYDSYILTPKAMLILNGLNEQARKDALDGVISINVGKLGELNHNGRIYMNGEHITAGKTAKEILAELAHPSVTASKIVEDEVHFEKITPIIPGAKVTHYFGDRVPLEKLTMKNEYKFESWEPSQKKDYIVIDSIPHGEAIEKIKELYPSLYNFAKHNKDLVELGAAFVKWVDDCKWVRDSHFEQIENPIDFPKVAHMYTGDEFLTMREAFEQSYFVERSHPYYWRWSKKMNGVVFMDFRYANIDPEIKGVQLAGKGNPIKILYTGPKPAIGPTNWKEILELGRNIPLGDINAGVPHQVTGKVRYTTGMALHTGGCFSDMEGYGVSYRGFPEKEVTPTVRTNGRQKLVDNGKRTWPGAKQRKGHRKHG